MLARNIFFLFLCLFIDFVACAEDADDELPIDNVIVISGHKRTLSRDRKTGQSVIVTPTDVTEFDSLTHLKRDSSVLVPETGRISASGFVVPKIRGQDVKLSDVYLGSILLQDPYSGLPLIEDLDLRAFGTIEIHQGLAPLDVPGVNPVGTMRYRFRNIKKSGLHLGMNAGRPFGFSHWGLAEFYKNDNEDDESAKQVTDVRVYTRGHQSNGRFEYYSDEGTPYNESDDKILIRAHNDQRSRQLLPYFRRQNGPWSTTIFCWLHESDRALPSMSMIVPSASRENAKGHLANAEFSYDPQEFLQFEDVKFSVDVTHGNDARSTYDPGKRYLSVAEAGEFVNESKKGRLSAVAVSDDFELRSSVEKGQTTVKSYLDTRLDQHLSRESSVLNMAAGFKGLPFVLFELKASTRMNVDKSEVTDRTWTASSSPVDSKRARRMTHAGSSLAYGTSARSVYLQFARANRLPSLLEEYGDGSSVRGNSELRDEALTHREFGGMMAGGHDVWRVGTAVFEDRTDNKIAFIPVMSNAVKALNVRKTSVSGIEARSEVQIFDVRLMGGYSRLFAFDESRTERKKLPGIPEYVGVGNIQYEFGDFVARWMSRYRSEIFRDLSNSVVLPGAWMHDCSLDWRHKRKGDKGNGEIYQVGFSVRNVLDTLDVEVSAPETPSSRGRTSFSDTAGFPLPGRQWVLSLALIL